MDNFRAKPYSRRRIAVVPGLDGSSRASTSESPTRIIEISSPQAAAVTGMYEGEAGPTRQMVPFNSYAVIPDINKQQPLPSAR